MAVWVMCKAALQITAISHEDTYQAALGHLLVAQLQ